METGATAAAPSAAAAVAPRLYGTPTKSRFSHGTMRPFASWPGNNVFCCQGRLMFGADCFTAVITTLMILIPAALYLGVICRGFGSGLERVMAIAVSVLTSMSLLFLLLAAATDPGIIPRVDEEDEPVSPGPDALTGLPAKYCTTCNIYRPPRAKHCRRCDNCVDRFDHHCPWIGNCVGVRNYRWFILFIFSVALLIITTVGSVCYRVAITEFDYRPPNSERWGVSKGRVLTETAEDIVSWIVGLYSFFAFLPVGFLCASHVFLIATNQTTAEFIKRQRDQDGAGLSNPFSRGLVRNCFDSLCLPTPESKLPDLASPISRSVSQFTTPVSNMYFAVASAASSRRSAPRLMLPAPFDTGAAAMRHAQGGFASTAVAGSPGSLSALPPPYDVSAAARALKTPPVVRTVSPSRLAYAPTGEGGFLEMATFDIDNSPAAGHTSSKRSGRLNSRNLPLDTTNGAGRPAVDMARSSPRSVVYGDTGAGTGVSGSPAPYGGPSSAVMVQDWVHGSSTPTERSAYANGGSLFPAAGSATSFPNDTDPGSPHSHDETPRSHQNGPMGLLRQLLHSPSPSPSRPSSLLASTRGSSSGVPSLRRSASPRWMPLDTHSPEHSH